MVPGKSYQHPVPSSGQSQGILSRIWQACTSQPIPSDLSQQPDIFESRHNTTERLEVITIDGHKVFRCNSCNHTSTHKATLERHIETKHNTARQLHLCPVRGCKRFTKGFSRPDNLARHIKSVHPERTRSHVEDTGNNDPYRLPSNPHSSPEDSTQYSASYDSNTSSSETEDGWCSITESSWEVSPSIEEVGYQREDGWEDIGGPKSYVIKQPLIRVSISDLRGILQLAGEGALIQLPDECSPRKGEGVENTIKKVLRAKEDAQAMATLASRLSMGSPASRYTLPANSPRQAFELLDQKIRETMEPSKDKRINQHKVLHLYERFLESAHNTYHKLLEATDDPINMRSPALKNFISSLVNVENIITIGSAALSDFLDRKVPMDLKSIYCMLHVSYSMSHSTTMSHSPQITDTQFSESAATWKEWLPVVSDSGVREQDIFDELLSIMWCEIKEGLENITEWFDRHINREQDMIMEEFDSDLPTAGVFQDGDPLYPGIYDPLFPDLAENDQDNAYVPSGSSAIDAAMPEELRPNCDVNSFSPSMDLAHESSSWESLSESLVITAASAFLQELESSGILFLDLFGTLESLFASRVYDNEDLPQSAGCPNLELSDIRERKKVVASMQSSLNCQTYPHASIIITKVSNLFLKGCLAALEDLEECTIFCLKLLCKPSHSVLNFFSAIVAHFSDYYHTQLPAGAKCSHDRYKNPGYVSSRFKEAAGFVRSAHRSGSTPTFSPKSDATSPNLSNPPAPLNSRKRGSMQAGVDERITISGKRSKLEGATIQREKSPKVYKFKVETGNPAARKKSKPSPNLPNV